MYTSLLCYVYCYIRQDVKQARALFDAPRDSEKQRPSSMPHENGENKENKEKAESTTRKKNCPKRPGKAQSYRSR
jgi:hypothetical protein